MLGFLADLVLLFCSSLYAAQEYSVSGLQLGNAELDLATIPWSASLPVCVPSHILYDQCHCTHCTTFKLL